MNNIRSRLAQADSESLRPLYPVDQGAGGRVFLANADSHRLLGRDKNLGRSADLIIYYICIAFSFVYLSITDRRTAVFDIGIARVV